MTTISSPLLPSLCLCLSFPGRRWREMGESSPVAPFIYVLLCVKAMASMPYDPGQNGCRVETEYVSRDYGVCCEKCQPGFFAERLCTKSTNTICIRCPVGEYTEYWNYIRECRVCPKCDPRRGFEIFANCTNRRKTQCRCHEGFHCLGNVECSDCERHSVCSSGQEMILSGTSERDTVCRNCTPGTFSAVRGDGPCLKHKDCISLGLRVLRSGSSVSDAECEPSLPLLSRGTMSTLGRARVSPSPDTPRREYLAIPALVVATVFLCITLAVIPIAVRMYRRKEGTKEPLQTQTDTRGESRDPLLGETRKWPHQTPPTNSSPPLPEGEAHGILGIQGCSVKSLNSSLTVHGPLYIYNTPLASAKQGESVGETGGAREREGETPQQETSDWGDRPSTIICQEQGS